MFGRRRILANRNLLFSHRYAILLLYRVDGWSPVYAIDLTQFRSVQDVRIYLRPLVDPQNPHRPISLTFVSDDDDVVSFDDADPFLPPTGLTLLSSALIRARPQAVFNAPPPPHPHLAPPGLNYDIIPPPPPPSPPPPWSSPLPPSIKGYFLAQDASVERFLEQVGTTFLEVIRYGQSLPWKDFSSRNDCLVETLKKRMIDAIEGESLFIVPAYVPVAKSFGFTDGLGRWTSGASSALLVLSHWEALSKLSIRERVFDNLWQVRIEASKALLAREYNSKGIDALLSLFMKYSCNCYKETRER